MNWSFHTLPLEKIDPTETSFDWQIQSKSNDLKKSINSQGLLMPLVVQKTEEDLFRIIDGFQRFKWMGPQSSAIPCLVLPEDMENSDIVVWKFNTMPTGSKWEGKEVIRMVKRLQPLGVGENDMTQHILPKMGLKPSLQLNKQLNQLSKTLPVLEGTVLSTLSIDDLLPLLRVSSDEVELLVKQLSGMVLGGNKWKQLLTMFQEIPRIRKESLKNILESNEVVRILHNPEIQAPVRFRLLKHQLELWRFPELSESRQNFEDHLKKLDLPQKAQVEYDQDFEKDDLVLKIESSSVEELSMQLKELTETAEPESWQALFDIVHGG